MSATAKFKLNLTSGEIEVEGSEEFVISQIQSIESLLSLLKQKSLSKPVTHPQSTIDNDSQKDDDSTSEGTAVANQIPDTFGEWMNTFKSNILDVDKALITARFVQSKSATNDFKTAEVNKALKDHGIKLSNPSTTLGLLVSKKLMFQTRKVGVLKYLRVSQDGQAHLETLKR
jgi:hypothetical protein